MTGAIDVDSKQHAYFESSDILYQVSPMLTVPMVYSPDRIMASQVATKALAMIKRNIQALLHERHEDQVSLAQWCGHSKAWINKFLNEIDAEIQLKDLDRIADFFGVAPYHLFQPGISRVTERRIGERRTNHERRIGVAGRTAARLQSEVNKFPRLAREDDYDLSTLPKEIQAIYRKAFKDIAVVETKIAREQAANPRRRVAGTPKGHRDNRRPDSETA